MNRKIHRWVSFPLIVFLLAVTVTGVYLQFLEIQHSLESKPMKSTAASMPANAELTGKLLRAIELADQTDASFPTQRIEMSFYGGKETVKFATSARIGPSITVDLTDEVVKQEAKPKRTLRTYFILLHSGKFFGIVGLLLILAASIILLILSVTGFIVYLDMYKRRFNMGRKGLFW